MREMRNLGVFGCLSMTPVLVEFLWQMMGKQTQSWSKVSGQICVIVLIFNLKRNTSKALSGWHRMRKLIGAYLFSGIHAYIVLLLFFTQGQDWNLYSIVSISNKGCFFIQKIILYSSTQFGNRHQKMEQYWKKSRHVKWLKNELAVGSMNWNKIIVSGKLFLRMLNFNLKKVSNRTDKLTIFLF